MSLQGIGRRGLLAGAGGLLAAPAIVHAQGQNGVALVIGNSKYQWEASLPNVRRDAPDIAKRFQELGLKTEVLLDAGREAMLQAIAKLGEASRGAKLAAVYFAGHGVFWDKDSYLVPVDTDLSDPRTAQSLITVRSIVQALKGANSRLLIFDSCRNSPADGWKQRDAKYMARDDAAQRESVDPGSANTLSVFSTPAGSIALDGPAGGNSPFAAELLRQLDAPSVDLQALPARLRRALLLATDCRQLVWDNNTLASPLVLQRTGKAAGLAAPKVDSSRIVELDKAYEFARQNDLALPPGLVAYRPAANTPAARLVGSYKHEYASPFGQAGGGNFKMTQSLLLVLAAPQGNAAELILAYKDFRTAGGNRWEFMTADRTDDTVSFLGRSQDFRFEYKWTGANAGTYQHIEVSGRRKSSLKGTVPFTRLDG